MTQAVTKDYRSEVIVIGAGLAGINAALKLEAAGLKVCMLEAQNRVGGRVHSMSQHGEKKEVGGTYIGAGYRRIIDAAKRYDVKLVDVTPMLKFFREQELVLNGEIIRQSEWPDHPGNSFPTNDKNLFPWNYHRVVAERENPLSTPADWLGPSFSEYDISVHEWLKRLGLSESAIALGYGINVSYGKNAHDVSALLLFFRAAFSVMQRSLAPAGSLGYTAKEGVQRIPEAMANALRQDIHCNKEVTGVESTPGGCKVRCSDGSVYAAKRVVCSLPLGVLRNIELDPPFSGLQAEALENIESQAITQFYFAHRSKFWEKDGFAPSMFTDGPAGMVSATRSGENPAEVTGLTAWAMGLKAEKLDTLPAKKAGRLALQAIETIRPASRGQLELVGAHSWGTDPFAQGGWAYFKPGQIARLTPAMSEPHGLIHFCGEHLATANRGMEGAMESGERAALEIINA